MKGEYTLDGLSDVTITVHTRLFTFILACPSTDMFMRTPENLGETYKDRENMCDSAQAATQVQYRTGDAGAVMQKINTYLIPVPHTLSCQCQC